MVARYCLEGQFLFVITSNSFFRSTFYLRGSLQFFQNLLGFRLNVLNIGGGMSGKDFPVTFQEVKKAPLDEGGCSDGPRVQISLFVLYPLSFQTS